MTNRWITSYEMADNGEYLEHYGRLGMKWGQHIFGKDPDKTAKRDKTKKRKKVDKNVKKLAGIGIATAAATTAAIAASGKNANALEATIKAGKDKPNISPAEKSVKELNNIVDNFNKIGKNTLGSNNNTDDLSKLSNEEIREIINRANLEEQYRNIMNRQNAEAYETVSNTLNTVGSAIAIVGSSLAIAASIKALRAPK